jgi:hypothetical protein
MLETLQLYCSTYGILHPSTKLPSVFEAPNLRHLQVSDLRFLPPSTQLADNVATRPSIVTFAVGEITTKPETLMACLASMTHLNVLKIGVFFSIPSESTARKEKSLCTGSQPESPSLALIDLEDFEYQGTFNYLEAVATRISAPFLKKVSITVSNEVKDSADLDTTTFKYLSRPISGAEGLAFQLARVGFKDGFPIVLDHDESWTGRGAFELRFNDRGYHFDANIGLVVNICRALAPIPSTVQSLLVEDGNRKSWEQKPDGEGWRELFRVFDNVKTLRAAGRFVGELQRALEPYANDEGPGSAAFLPMLQAIVRYGPEDEFAALVQARQMAGSPVRVVSGPKNRLTLF